MKLLPEEPTQEMINAVDSFMQPVAKALYDSMYQAAPEVEPLNKEDLLNILKSIDAETKRIPIGFIAFARAIEKAHGIGVKNV